MTQQSDWATKLAANVPGAWDEAKDALEASQPFRQQGNEAMALPVLQSLGATDKHRSLVLSAATASASNAIAPVLSSDQSIVTGWPTPGPVLELGVAREVARTFITTDIQAPNGGAVRWADGVDMQIPEAPTIGFGFRAVDGKECAFEGVEGLIAHVEQIVQRFAGLAPPPANAASGP